MVDDARDAAPLGREEPTGTAPLPDAGFAPATMSPLHEALARRLAHLPDLLGPAALPELREALSHPDPWVRWHAVTSIARLEEPEALAALVTALHDDSFGVHWAAAHALAAAGREGVIAVLRAMLHDLLSTGFLHGVTHVLVHARLTQAERAAVAPVVAALHRSTAAVEAPVRAEAALPRLELPPSPAAVPAVPWYHTRRARRWSRVYTLGV